VHTGRPAPFALTAPAFALATVGWLAATAALAVAGDELSPGAVTADPPVLAAHLVGLVFFPFAVAAAVWQLLPVMLRNEPPTRRLRPLVLLLLAAGIPLAGALGTGRDGLAAVCAALLAVGLLLLLVEVVGLVLGAPAGKTLVVSRPAVALALAHAVAAFALGVVALADGGPEPLGVPYERLLLVHVLVAVVGWLTVLVAAVGRTLVPMLGLAATPPRRKVPLSELVIVAGLWLLVAGIAGRSDALVLVGIVVAAAGASPVARLFLRVARGGRIGVREGPVAHAAVGLVFALEAALVGAAAAVGLVDGREAAVAGVLLLGVGWAAGVIVGHLGKLISLGGWGSWPPGPRPKQAALYPRRVWQVEVVLFAAGVQLLALGVLVGSTDLALSGSASFVAGAAVALLGVGETLRRVAVGRRDA
jgi:hypothetical protein